MKILPVIKNVEWTNNYQDVPYLTGVNKELWLLKNYLGDSNLTLWDNVKDKKSLVNTDRINATLTVNLLDLKTQIPNLYNTWNIYNLLAVNYFIGNEGQFYFVKKGTGATLVNATTVKFELELDSWMTNIHDKIINDNKLRYVKKGHANRLVKNTTTNKYELDFDRANPNWNEITGPKPVKEVIGKGFFSPKFDIDTLETKGQYIRGKKEVYKFLNDFNWLVMLTPLPDVKLGPEGCSGDTCIFGKDYSKGLKITNKDGTVSILPYILMVSPLYKFTNKANPIPPSGPDRETKFGLKNVITPVGKTWDLENTLKTFTQSKSEVINAGIIKGLANGCDIFPDYVAETPEKEISITWTRPDSDVQKYNELDLYVPDDNINEEVLEGLGTTGDYARLVINHIKYEEDYKGLYEIVENTFFENKTLDFPSQKLNKDFKNELGDIFNKEWDKSELEPTNNKDNELESSLYNPQITSLQLNTLNQTKELSYQLLKGKQPTISNYSSYAESLESTRKRINEGYYEEYKYEIKENVVGSIQNNYPLGSGKYQDFLLQSQAQHQTSIQSAKASAGISSITSILGIIGGLVLAPFTGGASAGAAIGAVGAIGLGASQIGSAVQSGLSLKEKKSQIVDLKNQPGEVRNTGSNIINNLTTDLAAHNDYLTIEKPVASDLKYFFDEVYENGVLWDFRYNIRWDSRYWFNYWKILDINKTLDLTGLNPDEIELVNTIFANGIRLWHIRDNNQILDVSKFDKENLEMEIIENGK